MLLTLRALCSCVSKHCINVQISDSDRPRGDHETNSADAPSGAERCRPQCRELSRLKDAFVLRRTAELNAKFLPPASTYIVFCRPSPLQACCQVARLMLPSQVHEHDYYRHGDASAEDIH